MKLISSLIKLIPVLINVVLSHGDCNDNSTDNDKTTPLSPNISSISLTTDKLAPCQNHFHAGDVPRPFH